MLAVGTFLNTGEFFSSGINHAGLIRVRPRTRKLLIINALIAELVTSCAFFFVLVLILNANVGIATDRLLE